MSEASEAGVGLADAWATGHMLGEALAYNALSDLLWLRHGEVISRSEYREARARRVELLPHWDTNPHRNPVPASPAEGEREADVTGGGV